MNETETLRGLIAKARRERDKSVRQLALAAQEFGHKIVGTTLNAIEAGTYHSVPSADTIRAIGWLAGVSDEVAFTAAGRTTPGPPFAEELPPGVDDLTSPERRAVIAMLRALVWQRQEINRYEALLSNSPAQPDASSEVVVKNEEADKPKRSSDKSELDAAKLRADRTLAAKLKGDSSGDDLQEPARP